LWERDACIVGPDGAVLARGHDGLAAVLGAMIEHGTRFEAEVLDVCTAGEVALLTGQLTLTAPDGTAQRSRSLVVHRRGADGEWRIAIDAPWGLQETAHIAQRDDRADAS
jgi:ketosteroid isomerase-like protein